MEVESHKNKDNRQPWRYKINQKQVRRLEISCNIKRCGNPKEFKDSRERNCNARIQNCLEKAVYKCIQTENKRVKIRLNFRKYVLSTKANQKSRSIIIRSKTKLEEIQQVALFSSKLVKPCEKKQKRPHAAVKTQVTITISFWHHPSTFVTHMKRIRSFHI